MGVAVETREYLELPRVYEVVKVLLGQGVRGVKTLLEEFAPRDCWVDPFRVVAAKASVSGGELVVKLYLLGGHLAVLTINRSGGTTMAIYEPECGGGGA